MPISLAVEAPTSMLRDICPLGAIELCFAHLLVGPPSTYQAYYRSAKTAGRTVILDNGIMERGVAASVAEMLALTEDFRPALVTPPEVLHDGRETLRLAEDFSRRLCQRDEPLDTRVLAIAHGRTFAEWCHCFEGVLALRTVERIGIPYDVPFDVASTTDHFKSPLERLVTRRVELCEWVARAHPNASIHLFGLAHPSELKVQRCHTFVESLDTSLPVTAALRGIRYDVGAYGPFEKNFLDLTMPWDETVVATAQHNVHVMTDVWLSNGVPS